MAELFKFRCYQCNQLLGGPASRVGSVTKCPKCGTELVIPAPLGDPEANDDPSEDSEGAGVRLEDLGLNLDRPKPAPTSPVETELYAFLEKNEPNLAESGLPTAGEPREELPDPAILPVLPDPLGAPLVPRSRRPGPSSRTSTGRRDVVMPRTAVVAWSMFALVSLGFAFLTGLLVGHFLWR